ncbi:GntR family transcriptional regulator [Parvibacter caecicola]|uniref:GntR family transcriptional regulator n=1 Tax=Parvibacter caecicola TaxID=747645 RepID=UPI00249AD4B6|nr:GntR family transcriptional regulator [Parvibacter caecicola]
MAQPQFQLDKDSPTPLWVQLRSQIVNMIRHGQLQPEQKMPTVRGLAQQLEVSPSVINQCYRYLRATGYLESQQGSGVRVRRRTDNMKDSDFPKAAKLLNDFIDAYTAMGTPLDGVADAVAYAVAARTLDPDNRDAIMDLYREETEQTEKEGR